MGKEKNKFAIFERTLSGKASVKDFISTSITVKHFKTDDTDKRDEIRKKLDCLRYN